MRIEPSSDIREACNGARAVFNGYVEAGFTEAQALVLLVAVLSPKQNP